MRLLEFVIEKMMALYEEFQLRKFDLRSIWMFYKCYNLAINYLGIEDKNYKKKNTLFNLLLINRINNKNTDRIKSLLSQEMSKDLVIISNAMSLIHEEVIEQGFNKSTLWRRKVLGLPEYEILEKGVKI